MNIVCVRPLPGNARPDAAVLLAQAANTLLEGGMPPADVAAVLGVTADEVFELSVDFLCRDAGAAHLAQRRTAREQEAADVARGRELLRTVLLPTLPAPAGARLEALLLAGAGNAGAR